MSNIEDDKVVPADVTNMKKLLSSMGVEDYEPRVLNLLMDFYYKYVSDTLLDAATFGEQLGQPPRTVDINSAVLALQSKASFRFVYPPPQEAVQELAQEVNKIPLPKAEAKHGLSIPPESKALLAQNYQYDPTRTT
uniref:Transcription initiation factor TFIID subunit 9 n=1 Tax=Polytomella parva TaxID=51329 RepID=A0A7S0YNJ5_9CHLO|mmetsp:Transcript_34816/g.62625  ORF Transcript_34816/g.62625 Transcript_34816/m.62625 type:complete len:136 (+) Transcript_34816:175-582(+)|eukprot:CAMPEP_0175043092 /NCGR_PEP_ID=MMETSP0052_2-20121109/2967_1 /TAXON_ID=51329 ORGANISM="Polytomella parva, Strain SAG 63-3" /NCGR_SAMPLE_ID=MMETSP0052_2 /ASSEMBLY_ACC=CAM_ASM_000194 /LENGTH=135 /DNA_ID=CAMNT_0016306057 /DNA_START=168 /DNA_END=575 /DNA_ORIENTATION=-